MKLIFAILLLVPLASANFVPTADGSTLSGQTAIKMIFSKDLVITESFDFRLIRYQYYGGLLAIKTQHNSTYLSADFLLSLKKLNGMEFVLENTLSNKSKEVPNYCVLESSEQLKDAISWCRGDVRIRELNMGESHLVKKIRKELTETGNPLKIVYDQKYMQTATSGLNLTKLSNWVDAERYVFDRFYLETYENPHWFLNVTYMWLPKDFIEESLVIDQFPPKSDVNCYKPKFTNLRPRSCVGPIQIRGLEAEDKSWFRID